MKLTHRTVLTKLARVAAVLALETLALVTLTLALVGTLLAIHCRREGKKA